MEELQEEEPVTFLRALQEKYSDEDYRVLFASLICQKQEQENQKIISDCSKTADGHPPGKGGVEWRNWAFPPCVVLQNFGISRIERCDQLLEWCLHLTEIDLSFNQLASWTHVLPLIQSIPQLLSLNLSFNPLKSIRLEDVIDVGDCKSTNVHSPPVPLSGRLKRLVLNGTLIEWNVVLALVQRLVGLEEVHVSLNGYTTLPQVLPPQVNSCADTAKTRWENNVKEIHVDGNQLESWQSLVVIGQTFPSLETLFASQNPLKDLQFTDEACLAESFPMLQKLHVNQIELDQWEALDKLCSVPKLKELRLLGTTVWQQDSTTSKAAPTSLTPRQHVIARLPMIKVLNGTPVESLERMDAERAFLRYFHSHERDLKPKRFAELESKHGHLTPLLEVELGAPTLVDIALTYPGSPSKRPYRLNVKQSVGQLKKALAPLTGLSPTKCRLFYVDAEMVSVCGLEELRYNARALHSYCIAEGDEIIVEPK